MPLEGDLFVHLTPEDQRRYMAKALDCNPDEPAGWPNRMIDDLIHVRLKQGKRAFYERLGWLLSPL